MSVDMEKTALCKACGARRLVTDRGSADILCTECGSVWGKWSPEHCSDEAPVRAAYERRTYFTSVMDNQLGFDCRSFTHDELAAVKAVWPDVPPENWDVGKARAATRKLKLKHLTKSTGRIAHALKYGLKKPYPKLHHIERESICNMFNFVAEFFDTIKTKQRKNLLSYGFIVGKLLEEVGRREDFEHVIVPIKTASKRAFAELVWKRAMKEAPWRNKAQRYDNMSAREYLDSN